MDLSIEGHTLVPHLVFINFFYAIYEMHHEWLSCELPAFQRWYWLVTQTGPQHVCIDSFIAKSQTRNIGFGYPLGFCAACGRSQNGSCNSNCSGTTNFTTTATSKCTFFNGWGDLNTINEMMTLHSRNSAAASFRFEQIIRSPMIAQNQNCWRDINN